MKVGEERDKDPTSHHSIDVPKGRDSTVVYSHTSLLTAERKARSMPSQRSGVLFREAPSGAEILRLVYFQRFRLRVSIKAVTPHQNFCCQGNQMKGTVEVGFWLNHNRL